MPQKNIIKRQTELSRAFKIVPYLTREEIKLMVQQAQKRRNSERDALLILLLFQTGVRVSEALSLTPSKIDLFEGKPVLKILGKGRKPRLVACPENLADKLRAFAYNQKIEPNQKIFSLTRQRAWQILKELAEKAGIYKRVFPHLLRHSDAIERLRQTGNPKALQIHLGHASSSMTMRYLSTLTQEDAVRIQQQVDFEY